MEPFGFETENWRFGMVAATQANCHAKRRFKPEDFFPTVGSEPEIDAQSQQEQIAIFSAAAGGSMIVKKRTD